MASGVIYNITADTSAARAFLDRLRTRIAELGGEEVQRRIGVPDLGQDAFDVSWDGSRAKIVPSERLVALVAPLWE